MARSFTELAALAEAQGISSTNPDGSNRHRSELMDDLREKLGTFDPDVQIDPMKAVDLKSKVQWGEKDPAARFAGIKSYLTEEWVADAKLDGCRMRLFLGATGNTMNTGRRSDVTMKYTERADNFPHLRDLAIPELAGTILDGEMMPPKDSITTDSGVVTQGPLNSIMALVNCRPHVAVKTQKREGNAVFVAFDVISYQGESIQHWSFEARRALLEKIVEWMQVEHTKLAPVHVGDEKDPIVVVPQMDATAENIQKCLDAGLEGVILKEKSSVYLPGKRAKTWAKVKRMSTGDFIIFGSVPGKGRNEGLVGSMKVAYYTGVETDTVMTDHGDQVKGMVYCADVAGISDAYRKDLTGLDGKLRDSQHRGRVIEVQAQGRSKTGRLRHPLFVRNRDDKADVDCTADCSIDLFEDC
jgi:bifunctional non-homologous end joining protein LigD